MGSSSKANRVYNRRGDPTSDFPEKVSQKQLKRVLSRSRNEAYPRDLTPEEAAGDYELPNPDPVPVRPPKKTRTDNPFAQDQGGFP